MKPSPAALRLHREAQAWTVLALYVHGLGDTDLAQTFSRTGDALRLQAATLPKRDSRRVWGKGRS